MENWQLNAHYRGKSHQAHFGKSLLFSALLAIVQMSLPQQASGALQGSKTSLPVAKPAQSTISALEGPLVTARIIVGPFDLHRKYRSMEGPYVEQKIRIADLVASKTVAAPESSVVFVEGNPQAAPSMNGAKDAATGPLKGLVSTKGQKRQLYWFKGIKLEVLDENNKPLPTAEFICHLNVDVDQDFRRKAFPDMEYAPSSRIITLTQGQTSFSFPDGFAVPVASDESWSFTFQAANRTTDKHRRIKHVCTLSFIKDADLMYPVKALNWYTPYIRVVVDRDTKEAAENEHKRMPSCLGTLSGVTAPNSVSGSVMTDSLGRKVSGHWVVPPGEHTYASSIVEEWDPGFSTKDRRVHAVWTHIHPLCTEVSLNQCNGPEFFKVNVQTKTDGGLQLMHIDNISSKDGIVLPAGKDYQMQAKYDNQLATAQDSMVVFGIFYADEKFARPDWFLGDKNEAFCGVSSAGSESTSAKPDASADATGTSDNYASRFPRFDAAKDGPLLSDPKTLEVKTSAGQIHILLDPSMAPEHATQMYKLFTKGAFNGSVICQYEPNYLIQVGLAESKAPGQTQSPETEVVPLLRRLPLEVSSQKSGSASHTKYSLTMARYDDVDSAVSSFSILLTDAHHLDTQYTVFGRIIPDAVTLQTITKIEKQWGASEHPYIISANDM